MTTIDFNTATAIDIIERSILMHPTLFREAVEARYQEDMRYAAGCMNVAIERSVQASAKAAKRGAQAIEEGDVSFLKGEMGVGIILLNIACKLQCIPPHVRTAAALRTWPD